MATDNSSTGEDPTRKVGSNRPKFTVRKRTFINIPLRIAPPPPPAAPEAPDGPSPADAGKNAAEPAASGEHLGTAPSGQPFTSLDAVPYEPPPWQAVNVLRKSGVAAVILPHGACSFALNAYFAAFLSGRTFAPFGAARYPGVVIHSTYTPHLDRSLRAVTSSPFPCHKQVLTCRTEHQFDWKAPTAHVKDALKGRKRGEVVAIIIDTGPFPRRIDERIVDEARAQLSQIAEEADCLILLMVEFRNRDKDPFLRVPAALRALRGTLLAVPLESKSLTPQSGAPAEFVLMRLAEAASHSVVVRFSLEPMLDLVEASRISWGSVCLEDPRSVFTQAAAADLTEGERTAVNVAAGLIRQCGCPLSSAELQETGKEPPFGVARTTMRSALTVAGVLGLLENVHSWEGRSFWIIPGETPIPPWIRPSYRRPDTQLPF